MIYHQSRSLLSNKTMRSLSPNGSQLVVSKGKKIPSTSISTPLASAQTNFPKTTCKSWPSFSLSSEINLSRFWLIMARELSPKQSLRWTSLAWTKSALCTTQAPPKTDLSQSSHALAAAHLSTLRWRSIFSLNSNLISKSKKRSTILSHHPPSERKRRRC